VLFPKATWEEIRERIDARPVKDAHFRSFARLVYGRTEEVACDGQGRLLIPAALRAYAGIEREVVTIGTSTRVEIWAKAKADESDAQLALEQAEVLAAEIGLY
jgi:MraZ protein